MKKIILIALALMLAISLAACNTDNLAEYKKALEKTDQITRGQMSGEFSTTMDFDTEGLTAEEIKDLNYFKDMDGSFNAVFDEDAEKGIYRNYFSFGGLGFDFDMYMNGKDMFMKIPVAGKYIKLSDLGSANINEEDFNQKIMSEETLKTITEKWVDVMKEDDVFKGKDIILTTPDGEVKTTEYTITLTNEQIKTLVSESIEIASKDESLKNFYNEYIDNNKEDFPTFDEIIESIKDNVENYNVENFKYTALVDIDGYIVNENIEVSVKSAKDDLTLRGINYNLDIKNWDINKEQEFNFPVLTEENTMDTNNMEEMPDLMKDLFKNEM